MPAGPVMCATVEACREARERRFRSRRNSCDRPIAGMAEIGGLASDELPRWFVFVCAFTIVRGPLRSRHGTRAGQPSKYVADVWLRDPRRRMIPARARFHAPEGAL